MKYKRFLPTFPLIAIVLLPVMLSGCAKAPSINILGAYFPGWIFCMAGGIILTLVVRSILIKTRLIGAVSPLLLFYPVLMAIFSLLGWIIFFQN